MRRPSPLIYVLLGVTALWCVGEARLKKDGYRLENPNEAWQYRSYDPVLGWDTPPGQTLSSEAKPDSPIVETVWADGCRASRPDRFAKAPKRVLVVGCSYTYGLGVADSDTWVWKIGARYPQVNFDNAACYAYGAYQSMLRAQRFLESGRHYDAVIYAAMHDHPRRDGAIGHILGSTAQTQYYVLNPRIIWDGGRLKEYGPWAHWPGDELSRCLNFAKRVYYFNETLHPLHVDEAAKADVYRAFFAVIKRLEACARAHGSRFILGVLEDREKWEGEMNAIEPHPHYPIVYMGELPQSPAYHLHGDVHKHPNAIMHAQWANNLAQQLPQACPELMQAEPSEHMQAEPSEPMQAEPSEPMQAEP